MSTIVREHRRTLKREATVGLDSPTTILSKGIAVTNGRSAANPPRTHQRILFILSTAQRLTYTIALAAAREARDTAVSTLIGAGAAWWLSHR